MLRLKHGSSDHQNERCWEECWLKNVNFRGIRTGKVGTVGWIPMPQCRVATLLWRFADYDHVRVPQIKATLYIRGQGRISKTIRIVGTTKIPEWKWTRSLMDFVSKLLVARKATDTIWIKQRMQAAHDRQMSVRMIEALNQWNLKVEDNVYAQSFAWKWGRTFWQKRGKLNPRYVGPFEVLEKDGEVAYKLELPEELSRIHNTFHVSNLKKCHADKSLAVPLDGLHLDDKLHFVGNH
ncbi:hypothetical protein Tco_0667700 [Tanacetum coccineum]